MTTDADLPYELETIQPVQSVSGTTLYNKVSRQPCSGPVDAKGQPISYGDVALVVEVDEHHNERRKSRRGDGVDCHLLRLTLPAVTEAPVGYYLTEAVPAMTRHRFMRDEDGRVVGAEVEHGPPRKQQTGFGVK
jgi:hypothetical protein